MSDVDDESECRPASRRIGVVRGAVNAVVGEALGRAWILMLTLVARLNR